MEAKQKPAVNGGEISSSENRASNGGDVVVVIPTEEEPNQLASEKKDPPPPPKAPAEPSSLPPKSTPLTAGSPEFDRFSPNPNRPPKIPTRNETLTRRKSLARSAFSKPKSRFGEQPVQIDPNMFDETTNMTLQEQFVTGSPYNNKSASATVSIAGTPGRHREAEAEAEEIYNKFNESKAKRSRIKTKLLIECVTLFFIATCLIASLTVHKLEKQIIWGLEVWKWCVLVLVTFCGLLVTNWFMKVIVFLIEKNFLLKNKVLYFVYGLKQSVQVFLWLCLILLTWVLLFNRGVDRSELATKILNYVTWTIVSLLIGSFLWLLKTLLLKILASKFHLNRFFERTQESIYHLYILQTLLGPPLIEEAERVGRSPSVGRLSLNATKSKGKEKGQVIDMYKLHKMKREKVSSWYMKTLVDAVTSSDMTTISNSLQSFEDGEGTEAAATAYQIFKNVTQRGSKYIEEDDLLRFMIKEEVDIVYPLLEGETGRIDLQSLTNWVVKVYQGRKALAHALSDTKTAVKQLNKLIAGVVIILTIIVWFLLTEVAPTKVLVVFSSQLVVAAFIFGNTCKTTFEGIIFVFVMHPFDVGDRCVVDGVQLLVEEMNILNTVFLKLDNEKVYYPNSVLSTKPISNYYRSPHMGDNVEFSIAFSTPMEKIGLLRDRIKKYLEENPLHWYPNHMVVVKEIENVNKIKMALFFNHTLTFQDMAEKTRRRTELVLHLKTIFEDLNIKYDLLHQEIRLAHNSIGSCFYH